MKRFETRPRAEDCDRALVFFANALGDHLMALPALRALSRIFRGRLELLCDKSAGSLLFGDVGWRRVKELEIEFGEGEVDFDMAEAVELAGPHPPLLVDASIWHSPRKRELMRRLEPGWSAGFFADHDDALVLDETIHNFDLLFRIPELLESTLRVNDFAGLPALPPDAIELGAAIRNTVGPSGRLLVVHAETKAHKQVPPEIMRTILKSFLARHPNYYAVVIGKAQTAFPVEGLARVTTAVGLRLAVALSLVSQADVYLGCDSVHLHAADLARRPGVALFGPTSAVEYGFRFSPNARNIQANGSMDLIIPQTVLDALDEVAECVENRYLPPPVPAAADSNAGLRFA